MTNKFYKWFWDRRDDTEKFLMIAAPIDLLFVIALQFTAVPAPGILVLTVMLTAISLGIFKLGQFCVSEYQKFQAEKDAEAEAIVRKLKGDGDELKVSDEVLLRHLKSYRAGALKSKLIP